MPPASQQTVQSQASQPKFSCSLWELCTTMLERKRTGWGPGLLAQNRALQSPAGKTVQSSTSLRAAFLLVSGNRAAGSPRGHPECSQIDLWGAGGGAIPKQPWEETHGPENTDIHVSPSLGHGSTSQQPHTWLALGSGTGQQALLECASVSSPPRLLPCPPHLLCSLLFKHVVSKRSVIPLSFKKSKTVTRVRYVFEALEETSCRCSLP